MQFCSRCRCLLNHSTLPAAQPSAVSPFQTVLVNSQPYGHSAEQHACSVAMPVCVVCHRILHTMFLWCALVSQHPMYKPNFSLSLMEFFELTLHRHKEYRIVSYTMFLRYLFGAAGPAVQAQLLPQPYGVPRADAAAAEEIRRPAVLFYRRLPPRCVAALRFDFSCRLPCFAWFSCLLPCFAWVISTLVPRSNGGLNQEILFIVSVHMQQATSVLVSPTDTVCFVHSV